MDASLIYQNLAVLAAFLLIYSLIAGRFESRLINGPLLFLLMGWLLGPSGLGLLSLSVNSEGIKLLAELTLVIVLFNDAANTNWQVLAANRALPIRLLLIGLPLTLLGGTLFGLWLYPDLPLLELAILSTILAPTDAALGKAVVSNPAVPAPIREGLNQESGLNDGICVPVLLLLLALIAPTEQHTGTGMLAMTLLLEEIGIGLLVALVLTSLTIRLLKTSYLNGWQLPLWRQLTMPGLALLCFALAQTLGGSGFIAAFVGGLLMGRRLGGHKHAYMDSCEGYGDLLSVVIWMVFGATLMPMLPILLHWQYWLYAAASLTLLRMLPVWLSLLGTGLKPELILFIGWFGPRGLASIVFAVMVLQHKPALLGQEPIIATVLCTIILSVILHGISANPWVRRFKTA
ncbi:sodium:proton antiporter [Aeromonas salmonicida]|uniref:NHE family transport protein n=1 Tax=Aeromonas salmonicida subsp. pectinolytica 34mel TaxID=1324960 RepID=T0PU62_AERSA|nr:cation:proton antiporter [Aeromonas salmonicida]ATP08833.1 NHE family transport protein [Aeromonas salmonicida subsp. pectinolytica 34mel]EQC06286.1 Na+/H+ antiporter [Aeromonas salmonicida subsp. pectinolytica 34mel]TNI14035.1 sodium:proton antiporter [Aeromonas salmonicida]